MSKHLERDLANLQRDLMTLASSVEEAIGKAIKSLTMRDHGLAQQVIDGDRQIDEDENHVEEECLKMLALHQPVAVDLRRITAALKINAELERMGDLAEDIAERAIHLATLPPIPLPNKLQRMTDLTTSMVRQSLDAFINLDVKLAAMVCRMDDEVDRCVVRGGPYVINMAVQYKSNPSIPCVRVLATLGKGAEAIAFAQNGRVASRSRAGARGSSLTGAAVL